MEFKKGDIIYSNMFTAIFHSYSQLGGIVYYCFMHNYGIYKDITEIPDKPKSGIGYPSEYELANDAQKLKLFNSLIGKDKRWNNELYVFEEASISDKMKVKIQQMQQRIDELSNALNEADQMLKDTKNEVNKMRVEALGKEASNE